MNYCQAIEYIKHLPRSDNNLGVERFSDLLAMLKNPEKNLKTVHIAGTNGKGSVSAFLTSILVDAGYTVGTYNSPSVMRYNDRFLLNGIEIDDDEIADYISKILNLTSESDNRIMPTAYEIETAIAYQFFADQKCDICIVETGLGGKWDATNVKQDKLLAIITRIGLDHVHILGDTLGDIASEKAGISRGEILTIEQSDEVMSALKNPKSTQGQLKFISEQNKVITACRATKIAGSVLGQSFIIGDNVYEISMLGDHQIENASLAIKAVELLRENGFNISETALVNGLKRTKWRARFEVVDDPIGRFGIDMQGKMLILDGSHNPQGASTLRAMIENLLGGKKINLVFGVLSDKDYLQIMPMLFEKASKVYAVTLGNPRALDAFKIAEVGEKYCKNIRVVDTVRDGILESLNTDSEVTIVCGSLSMFCDI